MTDHEVNELLRRSLSSQEAPDDSLNDEIVKQAKESEMRKNRLYRKLLTTAAAAAVFLGISTTALAAYHILNAPGAARELDQNDLAESFETDNEIEKEVTRKDGGYEVTLLGLLMGRQLDSQLSAGMGLTAERTYAAVAIAKEDGSPISEEESGNFFVSPLIEGLNPVMYNIATMNGGKTWTVSNGVLYYIVDCDDITCFADRGIRLAVQEGVFYDNTAYTYEETTGKIAPREDYSGLNLLFELPVDPKAADKDKQKEYLNDLERQWEEPAEEIDLPDPNEVVKRARLIEDSVKELKPDASGGYYYEYLFGYVDGEEDKTTYSTTTPIFAEGEFGYVLGSYMEDGDGNKTYVIFHRDENGKVTGMIYEE